MVENTGPTQENPQTQKYKRDVPVPETRWGKFWHKIGNTFHKSEKGMDYISKIGHPYLVSTISAAILGLATFGAYNLFFGREKGVSDPGFYEKIEDLRKDEREKYLHNLERFLNEQKNNLSAGSN